MPVAVKIAVPLKPTEYASTELPPAPARFPTVHWTWAFPLRIRRRDHRRRRRTGAAGDDTVVLRNLEDDRLARNGIAASVGQRHDQRSRQQRADYACLVVARH